MLGIIWCPLWSICVPNVCAPAQLMRLTRAIRCFCARESSTEAKVKITEFSLFWDGFVKLQDNMCTQLWFHFNSIITYLRKIICCTNNRGQALNDPWTLMHVGAGHRQHMRNVRNPVGVFKMSLPSLSFPFFFFIILMASTCMALIFSSTETVEEQPPTSSQRGRWAYI